MTLNVLLDFYFFTLYQQFSISGCFSAARCIEGAAIAAIFLGGGRKFSIRRIFS